MADIFEVLRRAETGDYIKEDDYNMKLYKTNKKLVKKYGLKFDKENVIVSDDQMAIVARDVVKKIEDELEYPGQIKVHIIRENRAIDYAK